MANKTIPQLPLQTGITDNDLLAIVDSGETTTSKIKLSTLLSGVGGGAFQVGDATDSIVPGYSPTSRGVSGSTTYIDKLNIEGEVFVSNANETFNLVQGNTTITDHPNNRAFAGHSNSKISSTNSTGGNLLMGTLQGVIDNGYWNILIGMGEISGAGYGNILAGTSFTSEVKGGNYNGVFAGAGNDINSGDQNAIVGGYAHNVSGGRSFIGGGTNHIITGANSGIIGGNTNNVSGQWNVILGGQNNSTNGSHAVVVGGRDNFANGKDALVMSSEFTEAKNSTTIIGGWGTYAYGQSGSGTNPDKGSIIIYSNNTFVRQTNGSGTANIVGGLHGIMLSSNSEINGQSGNESNKAVIIGSESSQITGGTDSTIMLGCSGRTGVSSYTTYVETLEAFDGIILNDYANLNFANDIAAAAGGVPLGGMYQNAGNMRIRIT